jgi:hypothetical protein
LITGGQLRAARALLRWSAEDLADRSKIGVATVRRAEASDRTPSITEANLDALRRALEGAGVEFTNGGQPGVKLLAFVQCPKCSARAQVMPQGQHITLARCGLGHDPITTCPEFSQALSEARSRVSQAELKSLGP